MGLGFILAQSKRFCDIYDMLIERNTIVFRGVNKRVKQRKLPQKR